MKSFKQLERIQKIDKYIKAENTNTPIEFANKLEISRSHLYRLIGILKDAGAEINYNRKIQSFYYTKPFNIHILKSKTLLSETKMEKIKGGFDSSFSQLFRMKQHNTKYKYLLI